MKELDISLELLQQILFEDKEFQIALKDKFTNDSSIRPLRPTVAALLGTSVRHVILLNYLAKDLGEISNEQKAAFLLILSNHFFVKRIDDENISAFVNQYFDEEIKEKIDAVLKTEREKLIPESIDRSSITFKSLRFNTPEWIIKVWNHFGANNVWKMLKAISEKQNGTPLRVRTSLISTTEVLKDESFKPSPVEDVVLYSSKDSVRKNGFYVRNEIFPERPGLKAVLDKFALLSENSEVTIFDGNDSDSGALEVIERYGNRIGINIGTTSIQKHPAITKIIKQMGLHNVNFFQTTTPNFLDTYISNPQDLVIAYPNSTNFDLIRENPDYFYHFKREKMDEILAHQVDVLEGCAKHVADQGNLLYVVTTLSKKECSDQVKDFLKNHPEFKLVEEKQMFAFDELQTSIYYAFMHKGMDVAKNGIAPNVIPTESLNVSVSQASAEEC